MKNIVAIMFFLTLLSIGTSVSAATGSGACSSHRGVDCSRGKDTDGSVVCMDGWRNSTVSFSDVCNEPTVQISGSCQVRLVDYCASSSPVNQAKFDKFLDQFGDLRSSNFSNCLERRCPNASCRGYEFNNALSSCLSSSEQTACSQVRSKCDDLKKEEQAQLMLDKQKAAALKIKVPTPKCKKGYVLLSNKKCYKIKK